MVTQVWAPQPGSQVAFVTCPIYEALYEGTRGPGKTFALLLDFAQHVGQGFGPHWRGILFRKTYPQLADVVAKSKILFKSVFGNRATWNASDYTWSWDTGEQLLFRHMMKGDDYWNYHGHEYPWIGFEELTNWANGDCYESMKSCSRSSYPGMPRKYRSTCNPYGVGHNWVKMWFIDPAPAGVVIRDFNDKGKPNPPRVRIHGSVYENKLLMQADPEYVAKLESIKDENKRKAWLEGNWDIVAGGMFDDVWDPVIHVLPQFDIPDGWTIFRSFDWGSSRPFSVGWWARADGTAARFPGGYEFCPPKGSLIRINEWYGWNGKPNEGCRMLSSSIADGIKQREKVMGIAGRVKPGPADSAIFSTQDGNSVAEQMRLAGVNWLPAMKGPGSRVSGWEQMRAMFEAAAVSEGPGLFVTEACRHFIRTVPSLPRDEEDMDDVDTEAEDHVGDETRYMVLHKFKTATQSDMYG